MKDFLKMTAAAIVGFLVVNVISFLFAFALFGSLAALGQKQPVMPRSAVLKIDLSTIRLGEQTTETAPLDAIQGSTSSVIGILDAIRELHLQTRKFQLIGYDNFLQNRSTGISTFDYNVSSMADAALELIETAIRHPEESRNHSTGKFIRPTYIRRQTAD